MPFYTPRCWSRPAVSVRGGRPVRPNTRGTCWGRGVCRSGKGERGRLQDEQAVCSAVARVSEAATPGRAGLIVRGFAGTVGALAGRGGSETGQAGEGGVCVGPLRGVALVVPIEATAFGDCDHGALFQDLALHVADAPPAPRSPWKARGVRRWGRLGLERRQIPSPAATLLPFHPAPPRIRRRSAHSDSSRKHSDRAS